MNPRSWTMNREVVAGNQEAVKFLGMEIVRKLSNLLGIMEERIEASHNHHMKIPKELTTPEIRQH